MMFKKNKFIIGMIHLEALPPYPKSKGTDYLIEKALQDLKRLQEGGVDGVIIENEWDHPHTLTVGKMQTATLTLIANEVVRNSEIPVGLSVLLNDWEVAFSVAKITDCDFVRLDVFVDHAHDEHWNVKITEDPKKIGGFRQQISADNIWLLADIQVKYKKMLSNKSKIQSAMEAVENGADMVIVTGQGNMRGPNLEELDQVKNAIGKTPLVIGNGIGEDNLVSYLPHGDGFIVGYSFKKINDGPEIGGEEIDIEKVKRIVSIRDKYLETKVLLGL